MVTVNLTSLLVLTTLFISASNSLPQTSYLKLIDAWHVANLCVPFAEVLLHTAIDAARQRIRDAREPPGRTGTGFAKDKNVKTERKKDAERLRRLIWITRRGLTSGFGIFVIIYFATGIAIKTRQV